MDEIPSDNRSYLCSIFSILIEDHFAYTLFGDKPVSLSAHFLITPWENIIERTSSDDYLFWKKWKVWEHYQKCFHFKNFLLIREDNKNSHWKISNIILINKNEFVKTVEKHKKLFEVVLNKTINSRDMLQKIEEGKISFVDSINNNQMLWGILLGYGLHNAALYNKKDREYINLGDFDKYSLITLKSVGDYQYSPLLIGSIHFAGDLEHQETKLLLKKYQKLRGKISQLYSKGDLLKITLSKLCEM